MARGGRAWPGAGARGCHAAAPGRTFHRRAQEPSLRELVPPRSARRPFLRPGRAAWQRLIPPAAAPPPLRLSHTRWCSHFLSCHRGPGCLIVFRVPGH